MSHSVKVSVALNISSEIKALDALQESVNNCHKIFKNFMNHEINNLNKEIDQSKQCMQSLQDKVIDDQSNELFQYKLKITKLHKNIANLKSILNFSNVYSYLEQEKSAAINKIFHDYGNMAILVYQDLIDKGEQIEPESFIKKIEENRQKQVELQQLKKLQKNV